MLEMVQNQVAFIGFGIFLLAAIGFVSRFKYMDEGMDEFTVGMSYRYFYALLIVMVPLIAAVSYLFMSMGLGTMMVGGAEVVWLRYFEWALTTPLLIMGVIALTQDSSLTAEMMVLDVLMILTGFVATVTTGTMKHGAFVVSSLFFVALIYLMLKKATGAARRRPGRVEEIFIDLRNLTVAVWVLYPIVWTVSTDGYALVGLEVSSLLFLGLDIIAKIGFAFLVLRGFGQLDVIDIEDEFWEQD